MRQPFIFRSLAAWFLPTMMVTGSLASQVPEAGAQPSPARNSADVMFKTGQTLLAQGKYQEAEDTFRKVYDREPWSSRAMLGIAGVYIAQKKYDAAIHFLQVQSEANPSIPDYHMGIAKVAELANNYDLALEELQKFLERANQNPKVAGLVYLNMGRIYLVKKDLEFSIAMLEKAKDLLPDEPQVLNMLAGALYQKGDNNSAAAIYKAALTRDPNNAGTLNNLAFLMAESGEDLDLAMAYVRRAKEFLPSQEVADTLGWIYLKKKRIHEATDIFRDLVQKNPAQPLYHYHLAVAFDQNGELLAAIEELKTALKNNPSKEDERKITELLQKLGK